MNTRATFFPGGYYHVYNQTNGNEALFKNDENRRYFLSRFANYLRPFVYVHSYALMSNHFHFSIQVKSEEEIKRYLEGMDKEDMTKVMKEFLEIKTSEVLETSDVFTVFHRLIIHQWQNFFVSYTKAFNKAHNRTGSLFRQKFKRSEFDPEVKFQYLQYYIHHNARKHGVVANFKDYPHTSYFEIENESSNIIDINKVLEWFSSKEAFVGFHNETHYEDVFKSIDLDEVI